MDKELYYKLRKDYMGAVWDMFSAKHKGRPADIALARMRYINQVLKFAGKVPLQMRVVSEGRTSALYEYVGWSSVEVKDEHDTKNKL